MKTILKPIFLFTTALTLLACSNRYYYIEGLKRAQNPVPGMVHSGLTELTTANKDLSWKTIDGKLYVLAVTWKADTSYYTRHIDKATGYYTYNTGSYPIFITASPYLKNKHLGSLSNGQLSLRLDQLLGLPPVANYSYFLEIWVRPENIIRPCFDPSTGTSSCEFSPSAQDKSRTDYMCWLYQYIYNSYADTSAMGRYPFTHLGYTYDWSPKNKTHVGLSEFVIGENADIYISKIYTTRSYFE